MEFRASGAADLHSWIRTGLSRIAAMDAAGIDVQIPSHTVPGPEQLEPSLGIELAKHSNDIAHATVTRYPDRFRGFATLPMSDPKAAVQELERTVPRRTFWTCFAWPCAFSI
jgi:predicted TIM-barrel fold metal-dependent hydrolase